jgi:hypothetical protein
LVLCLVEFIHRPEAGSQEKEIELLDLLVPSYNGGTLKGIERVLIRYLSVGSLLAATNLLSLFQQHERRAGCL